MSAPTNTIRHLYRNAEAKFGFRFACELHHALRTGSPKAQMMVRQALAA